MSELRHTPLYDRQMALGARFVEFGDWHMPVQFSGINSEHMAVRTKAGLFDVSHMGEFLLTGPDAANLLNHVTTNDVAALKPGQVHYSALVYSEGTFVDDLLVYCLAPDSFLLVVNAGNLDKDFEYLQSHALGDVKLTNKSDDYALLAVQGPQSLAILDPLTSLDLSSMGYYWFAEGQLNGIDCLISRTGYTGEDGFEIYLSPNDAGAMWDALLEAGKDHGLTPCGLGARDTLRLEAGMCLYGNDIDQTRTVIEAGLGWIVKFKKGDFLGRETLLEQKEKGTTEKLVAIEAEGRGIPRHGYACLDMEGQVIGEVTSGTFAPFLKKAIGLAYLKSGHAAIGNEIKVDVRGKEVAAKVVSKPFYKRT